MLGKDAPCPGGGVAQASASSHRHECVSGRRAGTVPGPRCGEAGRVTCRFRRRMQCGSQNRRPRAAPRGCQSFQGGCGGCQFGRTGGFKDAGLSELGGGSLGVTSGVGSATELSGRFRTSVRSRPGSGAVCSGDAQPARRRVPTPCDRGTGTPGTWSLQARPGPGGGQATPVGTGGREDVAQGTRRGSCRAWAGGGTAFF